MTETIRAITKETMLHLEELFSGPVEEDIPGFLNNQKKREKFKTIEDNDEKRNSIKDDLGSKGEHEEEVPTAKAEEKGKTGSLLRTHFLDFHTLI